jgi:dihydroorotate dehydrogenase electron transfer subunit
MLAESLPGEMLRLKGPLGSPLPDPLSGERIHLLGGGAGAAPLLFAADRLSVSGHPFRIWLGVPGRGWNPLTEELARRFGGRLDLRSDDGSLGLPGNPVSACEAEVRDDEEAWVCGPPAMVRAAVMSLRDRSARVLISREVRMACGVGGCLGCAVSTARGRLRACVEGPFFDAREVIFDEDE